MPKDMLDEQIKRIAGGDKSALTVFYQHVQTPVFAYALSLVKNRSDAEDVLHDTVLEVWRSASKYESMGKPMAWVLTIARNLCFKKLREQAKTADDPLELAAEYIPVGDDLTPEDKSMLRLCMESLSDDERETVILHAVAGFKHREIAKMLGQPLSTILSRYNRAIKKLQTTLGDEETEQINGKK